MDTNNWRPAPGGVGGGGGGGEPTMDAGDWRSQLQPDLRQGTVNKIMDTLKRHLPFSGQEGLRELKKIAVRFEEKIYTSATSQPDYLRKISLKMLTMETKSQNTMTNALPSNSGNTSKNPSDTGYGTSFNRPSSLGGVSMNSMMHSTSPSSFPWPRPSLAMMNPQGSSDHNRLRMLERLDNSGGETNLMGSARLSSSVPGDGDHQNNLWTRLGRAETNDASPELDLSLKL